jgi:glucosamine--fructose-6-phosphate aminotransferase (isomerizing)
MYVVKQGSPLVIGAGDGENFFASDALALLPHTNRALFLMDGEFACLRPEKIDVWDFSGKEIRRAPAVLNWSAASADKQGFKHYMLKEIHEQPAVMSSMLGRLLDLKTTSLVEKEIGVDGLDTARINNVAIVACGTAHYAGQIGRYMIEEFTRLPANVELASEFRYRNPCIDSSTLVIAVSQSGETADTLACVKHATERGCQVMSICNVRFSSIPRASNAVLYMEAGPEVGVASTKAFTAMVLSFYILSLALGVRRQTLADGRLEKSFDSMRRLPALVDRAVNAAGVIEEVSQKVYEAQNMLFIGRGPSFPVATEGALKLKEISYIHAEGYAGGELKHGPIALVDRHMPVVSIAPRDAQYEKMISNIEEVRARQGRIIGVGDLEDERFRSICEHYIPCPQVLDDHLQAILSVIPLQLLAYYVADLRGTDVDQPRNLAKSVTVE